MIGSSDKGVAANCNGHVCLESLRSFSIYDMCHITFATALIYLALNNFYGYIGIKMIL